MSYNAAQAIQEAEMKLRQYQAAFDGKNRDAVVYDGNITGLTHHDYRLCSHVLTRGTELVVKRDAFNKYDARATALFFGYQQVGWIPKAMNRVAAKALDEGCELRCFIQKHNSTSSNPNNILLCVIRVHSYPAFIQPVQEQQTMSKLTSLAQKNIDLGTSAAFLEAGRIANTQLSSIASKKLPIMVRAYADTAIGRLLLANIALMARDHFRPDDERLGKLVNAMAVSAYQEVLQNFDVEQMIDDLISNSTIKKALKTMDTANVCSES